MKFRPDGSVAYSTYLGASGNDFGEDIAVDAHGNAVVAGTTSSGNFPIAGLAVQTTKGTPAGGEDAFLTKLNRNGSSLLFSSFIGGGGATTTGGDAGYGVALDAAGDAYVTGWTNSTSFPVTPGAFQTIKAGAVGTFDAFICKAVVNNPPTVNCPETATAECTSSAGATIELTSPIADADGDPLTVTWLVDTFVVQTDNVPDGGSLATTATLALSRAYSVGVHTVEVQVSDGSAPPVACTTQVTVTESQPIISSPPASTQLCIGGTPGAFSVVASGTEPLSYQWRREGIDISGATSDTFPLAPDSLDDGGSYDVVITNACGSLITSSAATLTVHPHGPDITQQPVDATRCPGEMVSFSVAASARIGGEITYQWRKNGLPISGATSDSYSFTVTSIADGGQYDCVVDECDCGVTTSTPAVLTVRNDAPVLTLNGPAEITLECHVDTYAEAGAASEDDCDGPLPADIGGDFVDANTMGHYDVLYDKTDSQGNAAVQVTRTVNVVDTLAPTLTVDTTPLTVESHGSCQVAVTLPTATAEDDCDPNLVVTNDAPALFPAGETTTVTFTTRDAAGHTTTAELPITVTVCGCATLLVQVDQHTVGTGARPVTTKLGIAGMQVCVFDKSEGSCARELGVSWQNYPAIYETCPSAACGMTAADGSLRLVLPAGDYIVIGKYDPDGLPPNDDGDELYLGVSASDFQCSTDNNPDTITMRKYLQLVQTGDGKKVPAKYTIRTGSELLIIEPEYVVWDQTEQSYPFVFQSVGDWGVTATVAPPEGFVADHDALSADVNNEVEAVQFTITEVGSDLVPTETTFDVTHKGKHEKIRSRVGILLTPDYATSRGFNVGELRARGLIVDPPTRPGTGPNHGAGQSGK
ncbi:MAG TPA: SBBP repeat-containing protein [Phycisphaerae bacterium]|nr:SBBP repeat-containing protein [Phycisphaerae bacterium]